MKTLSRVQRTSKKMYENTVKTGTCRQPTNHHNSNLKTISYHQDFIIIKTTVDELFIIFTLCIRNKHLSWFLAHQKTKWSWSKSATTLRHVQEITHDPLCSPLHATFNNTQREGRIQLFLASMLQPLRWMNCRVQQMFVHFNSHFCIWKNLVWWLKRDKKKLLSSF